MLQACWQPVWIVRETAQQSAVIVMHYVGSAQILRSLSSNTTLAQLKHYDGSAQTLRWLSSNTTLAQLKHYVGSAQTNTDSELADAEERLPPRVPQHVQHECQLQFWAWVQAKGDAAVRAAMPNATIFKPAHLIGGEDRLTNNIAQLGKKCALPRFPLQPGRLRSWAPSSGHLGELRHTLSCSPGNQVPSRTWATYTPCSGLLGNVGISYFIQILMKDRKWLVMVLDQVRQQMAHMGAACQQLMHMPPPPGADRHCLLHIQ